MKILILIFLNLYSYHAYSSDINLESVRTINGNSGVSDYCLDAVASSDGGILAAGYSSDGFTAYALLLKYNSSGQREWLKTYRDRINGTNSYSKISTDASGNLYVVGGLLDDITGYDILLQKFSSTGDLLWTRIINSISNSSDSPVDFKRDNLGNLLILFNEQENNSHINLVKSDINGNILWHYRLADSISTGTSMSIDSLNNIYISGNRSDGSFSTYACILKIDANGNFRWIRDGDHGSEREYSYSDVKVTSKNEIYVLGNKQFGFYQIMKIIKIDSTGNSLWHNDININLQGRMISKELEADSSGKIYFTGSLIPIVTGIQSFEAYLPGYILGKFSPSGDSVWSRFIFNPDIFSDDDIFMKINNKNNINILCYLRDVKQIGKILKFNADGDSLAAGDFNNDAYGKMSSLALDINGNPVACGEKIQKYNDYDHIVKTYNTNCQANWESKYDSRGFSNDAAGKVLEDLNGNIYVAGYNIRQAILIKYDAAMTEQWKYIVSDSVGYEPYYNFVPSIVLDPSNNIYFATSVKKDSTAYDIKISKIDPSGVNLFSIIIASPANNTAMLRAIATDDNGYLYVSGATDVGFISKYSPSGNRIWVSNYNDFYYYQKIIVKNDTVYFMGDNSIIKYNSDGNQLWVSTFQPNSFVNYFRDFKVDKQNNVIACGSGVVENQSENYIIVKYDNDGNQIWGNYYNGLRNSGDDAKSIAIDSLNNILVSGSAKEFSANYQESITLLKLNPEGDQIWKKIISSPPAGRIMSGIVKLDKYDNVYVSSGSGSYVNFSYLLVKYRSNGDSLWSSVYNHSRFANISSDFLLTKNNDIVMTGKAYGDNTGYDITTLKYSQTVGINTNNSIIVNEYSLSQNFPNPFNPKTIINYVIPSNVKRQTSNVKLIIYNSLGKQITTLVNRKHNPGSYSVEFNGEGLPSGIYFYKIEAGDFVETKRMVLLK
ncbi:MAG: PQQ-binding-like beta-propeller repeat protein [Ignavibacteria bacterium]|nr:PQQ-binding-like beta-propeller repeat protein [Ignavibacteria bacterium]